ncbi:hypothetical protein SLU01_14680 [Sporosarcina luteola]|uniref:Uncharacterized protein n=1 Tax=Sporosarcina luteola TaxID=582850 RepID=A0A511Z6U0_9BACL|nr:hypothetical protein [Sporosarcina luteola]GEN83156.1 hypothetical protein SLU01_14680 [Sporosarcina luteola]
MNHADIKSNDPFQLKQTIIYLQAELNKYKSKKRQSSSSLIDELHMENEKLTTDYKQLLYKSKKHEKRISLYERQIQSLHVQRKESLSELNHFQRTEQDLRITNKELFNALSNNDLSKIIHAIENIEGKVDTLLHRNVDHSQLSLAEEKLKRLQYELDMSEKVNAALYELIVILEDYIQQMEKEADAQRVLVTYLNGRIDTLTSEQEY